MSKPRFHIEHEFDDEPIFITDHQLPFNPDDDETDLVEIKARPGWSIEDRLALARHIQSYLEQWHGGEVALEQAVAETVAKLEAAGKESEDFELLFEDQEDQDNRCSCTETYFYGNDPYPKNRNTCAVCLDKLKQLVNKILEQKVRHAYIALTQLHELDHYWLQVKTVSDGTIGGCFDCNSTNVDWARHYANILERMLSERGIHAFREREYWEASRYATPDEQGNYRWRAVVNAKSNDGEAFSCGETEILAPTDHEANRKAIDELWDPRLSVSGCVVDSVELTLLEDEEG